MTLPLLTFSTGNYNSEKDRSEITYKIENKGVGPAKIESFLIKYENRFFKHRNEYFRACCEKEAAEFHEIQFTQEILADAALITSDPQQQILPSGQSITYLSLPRHEINDAFWEKLNKERYSTSVTLCYCSMLDTCYWLTEKNIITETPSCKE